MGCSYGSPEPDPLGLPLVLVRPHVLLGLHMKEVLLGHVVLGQGASDGEKSGTSGLL